MQSSAVPHRSVFADTVFSLLNPIPFGCFVAAMIFDILYARTAVAMWGKSAAWLIVFGLLFALIPRLINLFQVWFTSRRFIGPAGRLDFWLNLTAIVVAIFNAFVHSRDAYAVIPAGVWLSVLTVVLLAAAQIVMAVAHPVARIES